MYFAKYGNGKKVFVGFHGWSGDHKTFLPLIPYVPEDVAFYCADLPGTGQSELPEHWNIDCFIEQICQALISLQSENMTILGSCSGGLMGLFVAKLLKKKGLDSLLSRLVLIDPYAYFPWYFSAFVSPGVGKIGWYAYYTTFANPIGRWMTNLSLKNHRSKEVSLTDSFAEANHRATYQQLKILVEGGRADQFRGLDLKIDVVYGRKTFGAVKKSITLWQQIFCNANYHELPNAGHLPIEESTKELAAILFPKQD